MINMLDEIDALKVELTLHSEWFGNEYPNDVVPEGAEWEKLGRLPFKLACSAVDAALASPRDFGPDGNKALVEYRQAVETFNQLVDASMQFQANPELWAPDAPEHLVERQRRLTARIHWKGIGTADGDAAHAKLKALLSALEYLEFVDGQQK